MSATYPGESLATQEYHYPRRWVWGWRLLFGLPSAVVLLRFGLGWVEAIFTLLQEVGLFPASAIRADFIDLSRNTWALFFLLLLFYFFYNIFPKFRVGPTRLEVSFFGGWYPLAWSDVTRLVSTQMGETERLIVLVQVRQRALPLGRRLAYSLQGALYGVGFVPGFLVISDLIGFDELVATIASQLGGELASPEPISLAPGEEQAATPASAAVMDEYFSPLWQMMFQPGPTLQRLVEGLADLELRPAVRLDLLLAAAPALLFVMSSWLFGHNLWSVLFVLFLALLEGALGPLNVWALSDIFVHFPRVEEIAKVYPYAQLPRVLFFLPMALVLVMRLPVASWGVALWGLLWLAQAVWSARQARLLAEEIYGHPASPLTWLGGTVAFILQLVLFGSFASLWLRNP